MKLTKLYLTAISLVVFSICATEAHAQEVVYFKKDTTVNFTTAKKKKRSTETNFVKIAPLSFLSGSVPIYYERKINDFLSVQVGAGVTTRNYLKEWINNGEIGGNNGDNNKDEIKWNGVTPYNNNLNSHSDFTNRKSSIGYTVSVEPRIYFDNEGIGGSFVSIGYSLSKYKTSSRQIQTGVNDLMFINSYFPEYESISDVSVNFGSQTLNDRISIEYTFGIALRNKKGERYAYTYDTNSKYIDGLASYKKTIPAFLFSFKVGYHW